MISFSPLLLLIPFLLVAAIIGFFFLINITHLIRTGNATFVSFMFTLIFLGYNLGIIFLTYDALAGYDWQAPITIDFSSFTNMNGATPL